MARRYTLKSMLCGILFGFFSRILYQQVYHATAPNIELSENCICHIDNLCAICQPAKVHITDKALSKTYKPRGMYEVARWQLFDQDHIFDIVNKEPKVKLKGVFKEDINQAVEVGMDYINLNKMMGRQWSLKHLKNGYIRTDSIYGTDIVLDLLVQPLVRNYSNFIMVERLFRVVMRHPLNQVENMQLESNQKQEISKIKILIPTSLTSMHLHTIIEKFEEIQDNSAELLLILFHKNYATADNQISALKQKITRSSANIKTIQIEDPFSYNQGLLKGISETESEDLIVVLEDDVIFTNKLLHHCRSICTKTKRVFFPVPFAQYNSKVIEQGMPPGKPKHLNNNDHNKFTGQWAIGSHKNFCGYQTDISNMLYAAAKTQLGVDGRWIYNDFLNQEYDVVMAVEPNLFELNHNQKCSPKNQAPEEHSHCIKNKALQLGSKLALGILYIKEVLES